MAYDEIGEWRAAVNDMSETDRAATEVDLRHSQGLAGDRDDARYDVARFE